jgi:hypothetical protein
MPTDRQRTTRHLTVSALVALTVHATPTTIEAQQPQSADGEWRTLLKQQLQQQYGCALQRFVFEREVPLGAEITREGRIQCTDGREIDYAQPNILLKFELKLCGPTVC